MKMKTNNEVNMNNQKQKWKIEDIEIFGRCYFGISTENAKGGGRWQQDRVWVARVEDHLILKPTQTEWRSLCRPPTRKVIRAIWLKRWQDQEALGGAPCTDGNIRVEEERGNSPSRVRISQDAKMRGWQCGSQSYLWSFINIPVWAKSFEHILLLSLFLFRLFPSFPISICYFGHSILIISLLLIDISAEVSVQAQFWDRWGKWL